MAKKTMQVFAEVLTDYTDPETGEITIDCFLDTNPDSEGIIVAKVTPDGEVIKGYNPEIKPEHSNCSLVIQAIKEAKNEQEERKQKLVDNVIEDLKKSFADGDYTVLDELLKFIPSKNLIQALPEEDWENYPIQISE